MRTTAAGYKAFERTGIRVGTQAFVTIDVGLEIGSITETVTVTAERLRGVSVRR